MAEELVRMAHISKSYGRIQALNDVNLSVRRSEIVGLLGDNGAGKSTLIKVLSGAVPATSGDIYIDGAKVNMRSTTDAIAHGIETIYQDSALVAAVHRAQSVSWPRAGRQAAFLNRMDQAAMNAVARAAQTGRHQGYFACDAGRCCRAASARPWRSHGRCISTTSDHPRRADKQYGVARRRACCASCAMRAFSHSCIFIAHNIHLVFRSSTASS